VTDVEVGAAVGVHSEGGPFVRGRAVVHGEGPVACGA